MSFIVKGLDMPKDESEEVFIIIKSNGEVRDYHGILLTNARAIQIPTPHGDLIDRDNLIDWMRDEMCGTGFQDRAMGVIDIAPTILY